MPENKLTISIDRQSKSWAVFEHEKCDTVKDFTPYTDEAKALEEARAYVASKTTIEPEIVYPHITSIRTSTRIVRRPRKKPPARVVKFEGINESGKLPNGGRFRVTIGEITISHEETR